MELLGLLLLLFIEIGWRLEVLTWSAALPFVIYMVWKYDERICTHDKAPESWRIPAFRRFVYSLVCRERSRVHRPVHSFCKYLRSVETSGRSVFFSKQIKSSDAVVDGDRGTAATPK